MNSANQRPTLPLNQSMEMKKDGGCPALFKAQDKSSNQEVYFETPQEAYEWMLAHKNWVLKKRETINWNFPLEQIIAQDCWVKME